MKKYIFLAILIFFVGYVLIVSQPQINIQRQVFPIQTPANPKQMLKEASPSAAFNLQGPLICSGEYNGSKYEALVLKRKIKAVINTKKESLNVLVTNGCIHIWPEGQSSGQRICGIDLYLQILESLSSLRGLNINNALSFIPKDILKDGGPSKQGKEGFSGACVKKDLNESLFKLPANVVFVVK